MTRLAWPVAAILLVAALVAAATPWRIPRATVAAALDGGAARDAGLRVTLAGPATIKLLPRPRLQATLLSIMAEDGSVLLDAPVLKAELDIPSLLRGVWCLTSATLVEPTATVDLDRLPRRSIAGSARGVPFQLRLRAGVLRTRSAAATGDLLLTDIDASATMPGDGSAVVVSGVTSFRGTTAHFAGDVQHPALALSPEGSTATLQIDSSLFSFAADGVLSGGQQEQFVGRASLATPSLPKLFRTLNGIPLAIETKRAQVSGDLVARPHDLSLSNAQVRLDRARFEGTLAWRRDAGRSLVAGTLATDALDLNALFGGSADRAAFDGFYRRPLDAFALGTDIDMRVSATTAQVDRVTVEDAAVAALVRGGRLELTLDEARAYGGLVKGRLLATLGPAGLDAHADLSLKRLDLASLSEGLIGRERVGGALTGHATLDGRGASLSEVVPRLSGSGQIEIEGGQFAELSLGLALRRLARHLPLDSDHRGTPTTFDKALWNVSVRDGVVRIPDGKLTAPGVAMSFGAETDLPDGRIDVHAVAAQTDGGGTPVRDGPSMPFDMRGSWAGPLVLIARGSGLPAMPLPVIDWFAAGR